MPDIEPPKEKQKCASCGAGPIVYWNNQTKTQQFWLIHHKGCSVLSLKIQGKAP